jgi:hypothetical protein
MAKRRVSEEETYGETLAPGMVHSRSVEYQGDAASGLANIIYGLLGILEAFLFLRFLFLLFGANPNNGFVNMVYVVSHPFVSPFASIFGQVNTITGVGMLTFDTAALIAMVVYGVVAWAVVRFIEGPRGETI